ncbi:MAG: CBASS cGAMP-activated phospholipase [Polyangiaceae bacterium]|nr:CBASS cGAMP-activated phospholipase [Polyangiaceae bacterium]
MLSVQHECHTTRALCLDGGGYLGLGAATFLAELERHLGFKASDQFHLFCGTSTGGIIALALASGMTAAEVVELYEKLGASVFPQPLGWLSRTSRTIRSLFTAKWSNGPLKVALAEAFRDLRLKDISSRGRAVVVPALCLTTGKPRLFKTDHHPSKLTAHGDYFVRDVALATASAPIFFPTVSLENPTTGAIETFVDGGVCANNPALLAYTEALEYLDVDPTNLRIFSISPPRVLRTENVPKSALKTGWRSRRGAFGWALPLSDLFVASGVGLHHCALQCLFSSADRRKHYLRVELPGRAGLGLDIVNQSATATLKQIGTAAGTDNSTRGQVAALLEIGVNNG